MQVLVTGAGGRTGTIVVRKLLERGSAFKVRAMVRSEASEQSLRSQIGESLSSSMQVVHGDVQNKESLDGAFKDIEAVIIVTSAMPQIDKLSLVKVIGVKLFTLGQVSRRPDFYYAEGQSPEHIDWVGQRNQIDTAKAAGVKHIVLVSSMAGTLPDHFLNANMDNIVLWKRKAEKYLIASGMPYTIIHPGGLMPHPGPKANIPAPGGKRQLFVSVDDMLVVEGERLKEEGNEHQTRSLIPREDVAEICVQSLLEPDARNRSFDLGSGNEDEGEIYNGDLKALLATLNGANCNYDKPDLPESSL